jgi:gamma-butyrobetaine dioxygenase
VSFNDMAPLHRSYQTFKRLLAERAPAYHHTGHRAIWYSGTIGATDITRTLRGGYFREVEILARSRYLHVQQGVAVRPITARDCDAQLPRER